VTIVVDLGCATHEDEESIAKLTGRFHPAMYYGFDPWPDMREQTEPRLQILRRAAWTYDGIVELALGSWREWDATVVREKNGRGEWHRTTMVPCFDLARFLAELPSKHTLVVKMDVEGAEFPLLQHLIDTDTDVLIDLLLVEWHDEKMVPRPDRRMLIEALRCGAVEEWQ
jgi:FkbM family methyltransferase